MKKFALLSALSALVLAGCATEPKDIAPTYVSPMEYESLSCKQLGMEAQNLSSSVSSETGVQQKKADDDKLAMGVGIIVFWPAIFFRQGDGADAANLAEMKGRMQAILLVSQEKHCGMQFQPDDSAAAVGGGSSAPAVTATPAKQGTTSFGG